jgi:predicted esterase
MRIRTVSCKSLNLLLLAFGIVFSWQTSVNAQPAEPDSLVYYWHKAFFAEIAHDPQGTISACEKVQSLCEPLPLDVREWFKGTTFFAIARAKAVLSDTVGTKLAISMALARHFWNFSLIQALDSLNQICGRKWLDSLCSYWNDVRTKQMSFWHQQPALLLKPQIVEPGRKYPVLIVLQGGNDCYERLVTRLRSLSDSLGMITVFPAAVHRISEVSNSWDGDTAAAAVKIGALIAELSGDPNVDTNNISLLGYSQGSQIAYSYAISHPAQIRNVIAFSGFAPDPVIRESLKLPAALGMRIIAISGASDATAFLQSTELLRDEATRAGLRFDLRIEKDLPHGFPLDIIGYISNIWRELYPAMGEGADSHTTNSNPGTGKRGTVNIPSGK